MRIYEILPLHEYIIFGGIEFDMQDFSSGKKIGTITTKKAGTFRVWVIENHFEIAFGACPCVLGDETKDQPNNPVCVLGFMKYGDNKLIIKNASTKKEYRAKGIAISLIHFVNKSLGNKIISDTELSYDGEAFINALVRSSEFDTKIFDNATGELFDLSDAGKIKDADGVDVIMPKDDNKSRERYNKNTGKGQRFFYIFEGIENGYPENLNINSIIHPYPNIRKDYLI